MKKRLLLFILLLSLNCFSQFSKTHYIPPLTTNSNSGVTPQDHYIYISTPSSSNINFKIIQIGGTTITATVNKSAPYIYYIGSGENTQLFVPSSSTGVVNNKGFIIESEGLIYSSVRTNAGLGNQAGGLVTKGVSALGKRFRAGAMLNPSNIVGLLNFFSVLATENNTNITISNIANGTLLANGTTFNGPITINLNKNEGYILGINGNIGSNMIGALIESNKDVIVNSGSFGGTNDPSTASGAGRDVGFDQIVGADKIGNEYIFIKGLGTTVLERVLLIADEDNTEIYANGSNVPVTTLQAGKYYIFDGSAFVNNNLYINTSKKVFAYQSIGGTTSNANQNLFFVPPLNCSTPKIVDNIPQISKIGNVNYTGTVNIVTENGATLLINDSPIGLSPITINGNPRFVYYSVNSLSGNISVKSTKQVYVSYYGTNSAATYGGYYSGFDLKPELTIENSTTTLGNCIPNILLKTTPDADYTYQWLKNDADLVGQIGNTFIPLSPGYYQVKRSIPSCNTNALSDKIPISNCSTDIDNDLVADNIDLDNDNDGITNCTESLGNLALDLTSTNITKQSYSNSFTSTITPNNSTFTGQTNGDFISAVPAGKGNRLEYAIHFTTPISLALEYVSAANTTDLINSDGDFIIKSDIDKTVTVLNPNNQLLIDTNYDGIYESGITEYSSFEIRFRLNSTTPLTAGTGTFSFQSYLTSSFTFVHTNLSDTNNNKATFTIKATCIPKDTDNDNIIDQLDLDSDNDGITDIIESQQNTLVGSSNLDNNKDGIYDVFGSGIIPLDTDQDGIPDYLDLDSDNDGIYDLVEASIANYDLDGVINGLPSSFGINGLANSLETTADSGIINYSIRDTDSDGLNNSIELDSDNDGCSDVIEAGFSDANKDSQLGNTTVVVDSEGKVTNASDGYTQPNTKYITAGLITINTQPQSKSSCAFQAVSFSINTNAIDGYQWQISTDGINWLNLTNNSTYSGVTTNTLNINQVSNSMNGYQYRVELTKAGNSCGLTSNPTILTVYALPSLTSTVDLKQCDDNSDGISAFNLTEKNSFISTHSASETFTYYTSLIGAQTKDNATLISNPIAYTSNSKRIWVRVENTNGCFSISEINLIVSSTQIPSTFKKEFKTCDDEIVSVSTDTDGVSKFDFSSVTSDIQGLLLPPLTNYSIKYYPNEADALAETNEIINTTNYRNSDYPNQQDIWVRVESILDNACYGLGPHIKLIVNPKPNIDTNADGHDNKLVCSNLPSFFVELNAGITDGSPTTNYTYTWTKDGIVLPTETNYNLIVNKNSDYSVTATTTAGCSRTRTIKVTASDIATINSIDIIDLTDVNSITVNTSGKGIYEYTLDAPYGPFQISNLFENVAAGIHDIYIIDKNGCGTITKQVAVIGVPKFFTPNGDGYNDYWNVKGVNTSFNSKSIIYIFDRYGKLMKQILPSSQGWDGTINGEPLPADDYWFTVKLDDGREAKGHFSLKR
jgi:gliding motility-associated-like protein